jgi:hypothetical protein
VLIRLRFRSWWAGLVSMLSSRNPRASAAGITLKRRLCIMVDAARVPRCHVICKAKISHFGSLGESIIHRSTLPTGVSICI